MKHYRKTVFIFILTLFSTGLCNGLDLTSLNLFYQIYPFSEVKVAYQLAESNDSTILDFKVTLGAELVFRDVEIRLLSQPDYDSKAHKELQNLSRIDTVSSSNKMRLFSARIPNIYMDSLLIIEVYDNKNDFGYVFDAPVYLSENYPLPQIRLMENQFPLLNNYLTLQDTLSIQSEGSFGFYYSYNFPPASPPMRQLPQNTSGTFQIDSSFFLKADTALGEIAEGLYLFQKDSSMLAGRPIRIQSTGYPSYRTIPDLIECTKYITTSAEYSDLQSRPEKANFDAKWLDMAGTATRAKSLIRRYYQRVEEANIFFTSYKEGWKTDPGMIYIIFGTPDEVKKGRNYLQWRYQKTPAREEVSFNFIKVKDIFSRSHYRLIRNEKYAGIWFRTVEQWRTGR